jgi:hypothetical protein
MAESDSGELSLDPGYANRKLWLDGMDDLFWPH